MWSTSKERCDVTEAGAAQLGVAYTIGERDLKNVEGLGEAASALGKLTNAAMVVHSSQSLSDTERKQIAATVEIAQAALIGS